jgi:hypothetical protein
MRIAVSLRHTLTTGSSGFRIAAHEHRGRSAADVPRAGLHRLYHLVELMCIRSAL